jgi:amino acid adenylation domain-containing protein
MVGILRAGGAYVPLDPLLPPERVRSIVRTAGCAAVIAIEEGDVGDPGCRVLSLEQLTGSDPAGTLPEVTGDQLAYILFTSGSTGTPKGVMVEHRALQNLCGWHRRYYEVSSRDRATLYARPGFDASIWEMAPYLTAGAALHVVPEAIRLDVHELGRFMRRQGITIAFLPTPICEEFLSTEGSGLERLLTGGDRLRRARHRGEYRLFNNYGPTETTVVATACEILPDASSVPIGRPIDNLTAHILDLDGNIAPLGVPGELCIGGVGLARGYLGDPEQTARCFVEHPVPPGERLYHTGDLCRWLPDGNLEFCGRIDHQVKIRGYRIELGEVESCLLAIDAIRRAVVLPRKGASADSLVAYLVAEGSPAPADLQRQLAVKLPEYMIPSLFVQVDRIPLTRNGKVDVAALRERGERAAPPAPPAVSGPDGEVVHIWQEVLECPAVEGEHRFFDVGGNSIRMLQLFHQVSEHCGVELAPDLFMEQNPSLAELIAMVREASQPS